MRIGRKLALVASVAALGATTASAQQGQRVTGPIATYWMSAQTQSGFGMPAMGAGGGGGRPNSAAIMQAMMGGGGANKSLTLQLGSSQTAPAPAADHLPPTGLGAGPDLPLLTPKAAPPPPPSEPQVPRDFQRPKGKMLIFWGCGEHAKPGQPIIIDFAQMDPAAGKMPANMTALAKGFDYRRLQGPAPYSDKTYGEWPNERARTQVPAQGSLVGDHVIRGNYSPEIRFSLDADQDFLGPINLTTNAKAPGGWVNLGWSLVPNAEAYLASAFGGGQDTVVMWTSSETQAAAFAMPDYLPSPEISRLVAQKSLMGPGTRACAVPKEVLDAMPQGVLQMVAYRGDANFVYPPRPTDPKVAWNKQWEVKVRYRSSTGGLLGQEMPQMRAGGYPGAPAPGQPQQPAKRPKASDILKGAIGIPRF